MENFFVDLNPLDLLLVGGEDGAKFLQGQLTCDVNSLTDTHSGLGAFCNNKGRVLSSFRIVRQGERFFLEMQPGLLSGSQANLDKYIVFYKAETANAADKFRRLGCYGEQAETLLKTLVDRLPAAENEVVAEDDKLVLRLPGAAPRFELWLPPQHPLDLSTELMELGLEAWNLLDIAAGILLISPEQIDTYTPEALNYDLNGAVSFTKGCYTGQEIVARMHYRGKAKKRLYRVAVPAAVVDLAPGDEILADEAPAGEIISLAALDGGGFEALALLNCANVENQFQLRLKKHENCSLKLLALPYT